MQLFAIVDNEIFEDSISLARNAGFDQKFGTGAMHAPMSAELDYWVNKIWDVTESTLRLARDAGAGAIAGQLEKLSIGWAEVNEKFKQGAERVRAAIIARLNDFLRRLIEGALSRVQSSIKIGDREIAISGVTIEQKLKLGGSLKASLEEICEFIGEGEISLAANYGTAD